MEAALLEGLDPDSLQKSKAEIPLIGGIAQVWDRTLSLLHWSAAYDALECTEVVRLSESALDYRVQILQFCSLILCARALKVLLEYGAFVDMLSDKRETPLHLAAYRGHAAVVKVNAQSDFKSSAQTFCCRVFWNTTLK